MTHHVLWLEYNSYKAPFKEQHTTEQSLTAKFKFATASALDIPDDIGVCWIELSSWQIYESIASGPFGDLFACTFFQSLENACLGSTTVQKDFANNIFECKQRDYIIRGRRHYQATEALTFAAQDDKA
jgi:hypothetical protein